MLGNDEKYFNNQKKKRPPDLQANAVGEMCFVDILCVSAHFGLEEGSRTNFHSSSFRQILYYYS